MKNRFIRSICLTLAILMTFAIAPAPVEAGRYLQYNDIDVTPLNIYCDWGDVELTILRGGLPAFKGKMKDITRQELDRLCQQVLDEMGKFAVNIVDAQDAYKKVTGLATKLDGMAYGNGAIKAAVLAIAGAYLPGAAGIATTIGEGGKGIVDDFNKGDGGWTSVAEKGGFAAAGIGAGLAFGPLGSIFVSVAAFGWDQYKLYDMKKELEQAIREARPYIEFLNRLRQKIAEYKKWNNVRNEIVFDKAKSFRQFTFYNTEGNVAFWELDMTLKLDESKTGIYGERTYTGDFTLFVQYSMDGFLKNPGDAIEKATNGMCSAIESASYSIEGVAYVWKATAYNRDPGGVAEITRTIRGKATAVVDVYGMIDFKFEQIDDHRAVYIDNIGVTTSVVATAPILGKFWDAAQSHSFGCNYAGFGSPQMEIKGVEDPKPQWWIHSAYGPQGAAMGEKWAADNLKWQKKFEFDDMAWRPWDQPNPPAELRIISR